MGALEQVVKMKSQGKTQEEIVSALQEQGISPKAINDAMNQSEIKSAVSNNSLEQDGMEPSIMGAGEIPRPQKYAAKTQEMEETEDYYSPQPSNQEMDSQYGMQDSSYLPGQEEYYPQEGYGNFYSGNSSGGFDTDTMIEIAEQVFSEKIRKIQKQVEETEKFRAMAETKIMHAEERLKRLENSIDKLQSAILEKVGSYGRGLDGIKKEMSMMQESFSKVLPEFAKHHSEHKTHSKK